MTETIAVEETKDVTPSDTIGMAINPELIKRYTSQDLTEIYVWAYNNAVFEILEKLLEGTQTLLEDEKVMNSEIIAGNERHTAIVEKVKSALEYTVDKDLEDLEVLLGDIQGLLDLEKDSRAGRGIAFALGFKAAFDFLNEAHEKMDQAAFKQSVAEFLKERGI